MALARPPRPRSEHPSGWVGRRGRPEPLYLMSAPESAKTGRAANARLSDAGAPPRSSRNNNNIASKPHATAERADNGRAEQRLERAVGLERQRPRRSAVREPSRQPGGSLHTALIICPPVCLSVLPFLRDAKGRRSARLPGFCTYCGHK